jgi:hypothetical protein
MFMLMLIPVDIVLCTTPPAADSHYCDEEVYFYVAVGD